MFGQETTMFDQLPGQTYKQVAEAWSSDTRLKEKCAALDQASVTNDGEDIDSEAWIGALHDVLHTPTRDPGGVAVKLAVAITINPEMENDAIQQDLQGPLRDLLGVAEQSNADASLDGSAMAAAIGRAMAGY